MECIKYMLIVHLVNFAYYNIKFCVEEPDLSHFDNKTKINWSKPVYGDTKEEISK